MSDVLVTGAAGFVGGHLHKALLDMGHSVIAADDFSTGIRENIDIRVSDLVAVKAGDIPLSVLKKIEVIFHFGEMAAENLSLFAPDEFFFKNSTSSYNLVINSIKAKVKRFVFASSMAVYGNSPLPYNEKNHVNPQDPYGLSKHQTEALLNIYAKIQAIECVNLRLYNIYGPNMNLQDPYRGVVGIFINQLLNHKAPVVFGDGKQQRAFTFVDDIIPYIIQAGFSDTARNETLNMGATELVTVNQLIELLKKAFTSEVSPKYFPERINEAKKVFCSTDLAKQVLGFQASTSIVEGIAKTTEWAKTIKTIPQFNYDLYKTISVFTDRLPEPWKKKLM